MIMKKQLSYISGMVLTIASVVSNQSVANITVSIVAGSDQSSSSVTATGSVQHIITDQERTTFGLGDHQLKNAVGAYFGKNPNDAYLHSSTPWGDLYKRYSWPQVKMIMVVESAELLSITSKPIIVKTQYFENNSNYTGKFNVNISDKVSNTVSSNWSTGGTLTVGQKFEYGVSFLGSGAKGETSISYSQSWGVGGKKSQTVTVGSTSGVAVSLKPCKSVAVKLFASRGVMKVRLRYKAYLIGSTAINYNPTYKGHHFWSLNIGNVMRKAGISNSISSIEDIEIGYYSNATVKLKNRVNSCSIRKGNSTSQVPPIKKAIKAANVDSTALALDFKASKRDGKCPAGSILATPQEARSNTNKACAALGTWYIVRLAGNGSMDGSGYGCKIRDKDSRNLGGSLCVVVP
jgi:hypothetical protein